MSVTNTIVIFGTEYAVWPASYGRPSGVLAGGQLLVLMSFGQSSSEYASFVYSPSTSVYVPKFDQGPEQETEGAR
ncbi:hypothetical protein N7532_006449 [Penicillium argentinense]|uniref:Uncharacterized protein n=1 Tax=Penicillium argentinense TaxID=1131581 RepID=A0A9W9KAX6_9EURO|nr:uncharacterized protein N7532_006449 [Penicillium argentinense]KAJ5099448.1 hypothetical protein N7532_006449 [Penicillium argentinense]